MPTLPPWAWGNGWLTPCGTAPCSGGSHADFYAYAGHRSGQAGLVGIMVGLALVMVLQWLLWRRLSWD
jgi:hypothetical protein